MRILGLDIGTNSIGGALINIQEFGKKGNIEWMGSRIIPVDGDSLQKFENGGQVETKAAARRMLRGSRRLKQRYKLRRTRLIQVFKALGWVDLSFPENFKKQNPDFKFNINDYLPISSESRKEAYEEFGSEAISEDWLVYYLRAKALTRKITLQELARIIYMLNQRRGFKSSRKEINLQDESDEDKWPKIEKWIEILQVASIKEVEKQKDRSLFEIQAGRYTSQALLRYKPDWEGQDLELEVTKKTTKGGEVTYVFRKPDVSDWEKKKAALHEDIRSWFERGLCKTVGEYFFVHLKEDKNYRIRQRIVERELYKEELQSIWDIQAKFHPQLSDTSRLPDIAAMLYKKNRDKQREIGANDILHLFSNDIIYYQRPLKSQKHSIDVCRFETKKIDMNGELVEIGVRVAPKSSPEFQEFRIWQDIHNIRIFQREALVDGRTMIDVEVTDQFITPTSKESLFRLFDSNAEVSMSALLKSINKTLSPTNYFVNLFANREKLKGNETKAIFRKVFKKHNCTSCEAVLDDPNLFYRLWHVLYSLPEEREIQSALHRFVKPDGFKWFSDEVISHLSKLPELPRQYAAYSSKAIKKLLPVMRCGSFWKADAVSPEVAQRIEKLLTAEENEAIDERTAVHLAKFAQVNENYYSGMPVWLATYAVYGRHAERTSGEKYTNPDQIDVNQLIPSNSLRNPFVEQVIRETLQVVKEIWKKFGQPDQIHIELARELKKTAEEKAEISAANLKNNAEKERIKKLLIELKSGNPQSLADVEKFRLWKANGGFEGGRKFDELFNKKNEFVSTAELSRYRLWAEQNYLSPYTGQPIPLSKLFGPEYEVEHIFARRRFFDDSFANKVICETGVNKAKGNTIARQFIQQSNGTVSWGGKEFTLLDDEHYLAHCKKVFKGKKLRNLLAEEIPSDFVSRQLNDTRHITRKLAELLYPVATEKEGIVFTGGAITAELKDRWGLNKIWKEALIPRFRRLEQITGEPLILEDVADPNKFHFAKDYKRVDHRHHALDALIIAATQRGHIQYLNTLNAADEQSATLRRRFAGAGYRDFILPWPGFTQDARNALKGIIVSHKATNRVVTKPLNRYLKWVEDGGVFKKKLVSQVAPSDFGKNWTAVRRSMFKEPQGVIYLKEVVQKKLADAIAVQINKEQTTNKKGQRPVDYVYDQQIRPMIKDLIKQFGPDLTAIKTYLKKNPLKNANGETIDRVNVAVFQEYAAKRVALDASFDEKKIAKIPYSHHVSDPGKQKTLPQLLKEHLAEMGSPVNAFAGEGLDQLYKKLGFPLKKVTIYEAKDPSTKFKGRYYETDKGGNIFFVIREADGKRKMFTLPLLEAIERLANKLPLVDHKPGCIDIVISPNELVYVPEEGENVQSIDWSNKTSLFDRVYKMVSCSGGECYFLPHYVSSLLLPYNSQTKLGEFGSLNKTENTSNGISIKKNCIKLKVDRLGNIQPA